MTMELKAIRVLPLVALLSVSNAGSANGVFNGPVTEGDLAAQENGRELELGAFLTRHRDCALESFKDVYRQVYPQYRGEVVVPNFQGPIDASASNLSYYFADQAGVKRIYGFYFIGPKDAGLDDTLPPQLVFSLNGTSFFGGFPRPDNDPLLDGTVSVSRFESVSDVNLVGKFPGLKFDVERRVDGYDALGRPVNARNVVGNIRFDANADLGARVAFTNSQTGRPTVVTWNARAFANCLASGLPVSEL